MNKKLFISVVACASLLAISCDGPKQMASENGSIPSEVMDEPMMMTIDMLYMNRDVRPQDDFFEFCNGTWLKENPVPASESRWGSFNELEKTNNAKLTSILEAAIKNKGERGSMNQILGDYYGSYMNMATRSELGMDPIRPQLEMIKKVNSKKDLPRVLAQMHRLGISGAFSFGVGQDLKNVEGHISYLGQGGIGLPNRDYYFEKDKEDILNEYQEFIFSIMKLTDMSDEDAKVFATNIIEFESSLAVEMMAPAELRIPEKTYNKLSMEDLRTRFGKFDFDTYLKELGSQTFDSLIVSQPEFVTKVAEMVESVDLPIWKDYLNWKVMNHYAGHLDENFVEVNFSFYGTTLSGKKEMKPINERAIQEITRAEFGELLGKAFVEKYFTESAKNRVDKMVDNLLIVFQERIQQLAWMSNDTKKQALTKLNAIGRKLGYPSKWEDFSSLDFKRDFYVQNINELELFSHEKNMKKLYEPVDKDEWGMPPHMVNAYYHPLMNEIAFPAGIMQAPFFSDDYEDAVNYGRIGMVIGHEFTHGFDDMGSKFAADGSFSNWWTDEDRKLFEERTGLLGETFSSFCPVRDHCVNPDLTMGENIADLGGLTMAYYAYQRTEEYKSGLMRHGFTPAQRFFISYAQLWKINYTEEELKNRIANDPHSPGMYRVNGPLMNCPEFFDAFGVKEEDPMRNSESKVARIW